MSVWAPKRFWSTTSVEEIEGGFEVLLDARRVKTPAKAPLILPTRAMAQEVAQEWQAQDEKIDPTSMPATRSANAAIDKVTPQHAEVADMIAAYGDCDLICYRADSPVELVERQAQGWDPLIDWARAELSVSLSCVTGVIHSPQDENETTKLTRKVHDLNAFELAAFHDLVSLSGSLIIGFAAIQEHMDPSELWLRSRIDEIWQEEQWGSDEEASEMSEVKRRAFMHADRFFHLARKRD